MYWWIRNSIAALVLKRLEKHLLSFQRKLFLYKQIRLSSLYQRVITYLLSQETANVTKALATHTHIFTRYITYSKSIYAIPSIAYILFLYKKLDHRSNKQNEVHKKFTRTFLFGTGEVRRSCRDLPYEDPAKTTLPTTSQSICTLSAP